MELIFGKEKSLDEVGRFGRSNPDVLSLPEEEVEFLWVEGVIESARYCKVCEAVECTRIKVLSPSIKANIVIGLSLPKER